MTTLLVTGGAGFIGSNLVRMIAHAGLYRVVILDALTYAGNLENLDGVIDNDSVVFVHGSITDSKTVADLLQTYSVDSVIHLAAESHVDRSIESAAPFISTNITGTFVLIDAVRNSSVRRFLHVSTDEVYGSLTATSAASTEGDVLNPTSPYAASKASSDLIVQSFARTYGIDAVITRCSNNYGPYQFPEKFIPLMILQAIDGSPLPIYGDGKQVRDWIHVDDHCRGILAALENGVSGETYNLGANCEKQNLELALSIVHSVGSDKSLIEHIRDRPAHDRRYALDSTKARTALGWEHQITFESGLANTIAWYQKNSTWCTNVRSGEYQTYFEKHYSLKQ